MIAKLREEIKEKWMMILSPSEPADHVPECNVLRRGCKSIADPIA